MKARMKSFAVGSVLIILFAISFAPALALADHNNPNSAVWNPSILKGPLVVCTGSTIPATQSPGGSTPLKTCTNLCDLVANIANIIYFMIGVVIWIITPIMFAVGGIMMLVSRGSPENIGSARKILTGTVVGVLITLLAYIIVLTFVNVIGIANIGGFSSGAAACVIT